jgi:hypothetical protein
MKARRPKVRTSHRKWEPITLTAYYVRAEAEGG